MANGFALKESGKIALSCSQYEKAIELAEDDRERCEAHENLLRIYPEIKRLDKFFESLEYILVHAPTPAFSSLSLDSAISVCQRKGLTGKMRERYENTLTQSPKDRIALTVMSELSRNLSRNYSVRAGYLQQLIDLDKEEQKAPNSRLYTQLAFMWQLDNQYLKAAEMYEFATSLDKDSERECWKDAALCWKKAGNKDKSLAAALRAYELGPDPKDTFRRMNWYRDLGQLFVLLGQKKIALEYTAAALKEVRYENDRESCEILVLAAKGLPDTE